LVLALSVAMCGVSGMLASRKVSRADPADLF
jgi:ABC-type antimicrobial peptide transport system permease subunit